MPLGIALTKPITPSNWRNHPQIVEIRAVYQQVLALVQTGRRYKAKTFAYCPSLDLVCRLYTDGRGVARRYAVSGGGEDSSYSFDHIYDSQGRLRFVLVIGSAVDKSFLELRYYLGVDGTVLWVDRRQGGPGYTWIVNPLAFFARQPQQAFAAPDPCK
ncbi:hypothetical protein [Meiothermus sp.]|uniref:hypothetical protein n=1 Tax=Meiothermus sp. TaxID=1955249 RepID=UPI00307CF819